MIIHKTDIVYLQLQSMTLQLAEEKVKYNDLDAVYTESQRQQTSLHTELAALHSESQRAQEALQTQFDTFYTQSLGVQQELQTELTELRSVEQEAGQLRDHVTELETTNLGLRQEICAVNVRHGEV